MASLEVEEAVASHTERWETVKPALRAVAVSGMCPYAIILAITKVSIVTLL